MSHRKRNTAISILVALVLAVGIASLTMRLVHQSRVDVALIHAVKNDDLHGVQIALRRGADPNVHVVYKNGVHNVVDAIGFIVHSRQIYWHDAPILVYEAQGGGRNGVAIMQALLNAGAEVNRTDQNGSTALMNAAGGGRASLVSILLRNHADPSIQTSRGITALSEATDFGRKDVIGILKQSQ